MSQRKATMATVDSTLVYYDGPQLLLLKSEYGEYLIGLAVEHEGYRYPVLACQVLPRYLNRYLAGKADLRFLFTVTPAKRMYLADLGVKADRIRLVRVDPDEVEGLLPEHGLFSRLHTHSESGDDEHADRLRFFIDGTWEARDFSRFHGRMADAYSLLYIAQKLREHSPSPQEVRFLKSAIADKPWQGGGSYLSFYSAMREDAIPIHALRVAGIEYHSPGYVDMAGQRAVLNDVLSSINGVMGKHRELVTVYRTIRRVLSGEGMLSSSKESTFATETAENFVREQTVRFCELLALPNPVSLLEACDHNVAVYAKLVLSYYRRLKGIADFFIEGRVALKRQHHSTFRPAALYYGHAQ